MAASDSRRSIWTSNLPWPRRHIAGRRLTFPCAAFMLGCLLIFATAASAASYSADAVKAAYLYHFGSYVEWPPLQQEREAIVIGVVGGEGVLGELRTLLPGKSIHNRPVGVRALTARDTLDGIHILYIGRSTPPAARALIKIAREKSILVITDVPEGLERGGMINFVIAEKRVRFEIAPQAAEQAGLRLSSRLLAVALRVHSSGLFREGESNEGADSGWAARTHPCVPRHSRIHVQHGWRIGSSASMRPTPSSRMCSISARCASNHPPSAIRYPLLS